MPFFLNDTHRLLWFAVSSHQQLFFSVSIEKYPPTQQIRNLVENLRKEEKYWENSCLMWKT